MNGKLVLHGHSSSSEISSAESRGVARFSSASVVRILDAKGGVDFLALLSFFEQTTHASLCEFFEHEEHQKNILFPFLDFLRHTFFSENKPIPEKVLRSFQNIPPIRAGIFSYVKERNLPIFSTQHTEQYDIIAFDLFLLGADQDFDLVKDIQQDHFQGIEKLLMEATAKIFMDIGSMRIWNNEDPSEALIRDLQHVLRIAETINVLALIHAGNFEERQISSQLDCIIRKNIDFLLAKMGDDFTKNHAIGKELDNLCGQVQVNFGHAVPIDGKDPDAIRKQIVLMKQRLHEGFERQKVASFGGLPQKEEKCAIFLKGNETLAELVGLEKIKMIQGSLSHADNEKKKQLLGNLIYIYNYATKKDFASVEEIFEDLYIHGIQNEIQIESLYNLILHGIDISEDSLKELLSFFLSSEKQINNFFHEQFTIKIIAQIVRKLCTCSNHSSLLPLIEKVHVFLKEKDVSHTILSYAKIYLSLALFYIKSTDDALIREAQICFLHYKNLSTQANHLPESLHYTQDEKLFYKTLGERDEWKRYAKSLQTREEDLEMSGEYLLEQATELYQQRSLLDIEAEVGHIISSMNIGERGYSQDEISALLGKKIAQILFYNLCTITVTGDCRNCETKKDLDCDTHEGGIMAIKSGDCPMVRTKRGFQQESVELDKDTSLVFTYPAVSQRIFAEIFKDPVLIELIKERFLNLIAINRNNVLLQESMRSLERSAFYDQETELPNAKRLEKDLVGKTKTLMLIHVNGYDNTVESQLGEEHWESSMKRLSTYFLSAVDDVAVYRYDKTTFCLVYDQKLIENKAILVKKSIEDFMYFLADNILVNFQLKSGGSTGFHVGIVVGHIENHIRHAHIALTKSRSSRVVRTHVFNQEDAKAPEQERHHMNMLHAALDETNSFTSLVPYYQRIHDPKNSERKKVEALARIEDIAENGEKIIIPPAYFIELARKQGILAKTTFSLLLQVIADMQEDPNLEVSINLDDQDWGSEQVMVWFRSLQLDSPELVHRITLEILETVPFDNDEDLAKIRELQKLGYKISIDDYGENNGNLYKIMLIRPDYIKIDQKIIYKGLKDHREDAISAIKGVVYHARLIGAQVIAERVETEEVFLLLQELGVDYFQGFYFAKPVPFAEL